MLADAEPLRNKGQRAITVLTAAGAVRLQRRYFWSRVSGGCCPADDLLGIDATAVSRGAAQWCCTLTVNEAYAAAARDLKRITGLSVSKERARQITLRFGREARLQPPTDELNLHDADVAYVGVDGFMLRCVTDAEKRKRRRHHAVRRQQRSRAGVGNAKPLPPAKAGTAEAFHEFKLGQFYTQDRRRELFVTGADSVAFGDWLGQTAERCGFAAARRQVSVTDGAVWIRKQLDLHLPDRTDTLLDFYHAAEHIHAAAKVCFSDDEATSWAEQRCAELKQSQLPAVLTAIDAQHKTCRAKAKRHALTRLRHYLTERADMLGYAAAKAAGVDIGSGPTEAMCKCLQHRSKGSGMKFDPDTATDLLALTSLRLSATWPTFWRSAA